MAVLERIAEGRHAPLTVVGQDVTFECLSASLAGQTFSIESASHNLPLEIPLLGAHQVVNAVVAVTAASVADKQGLPIGSGAVGEGLKQVKWPGRFEIVRRDPPLVLDSAHNADSARKLAAALEEIFPGLRWALVFGASADKDIAAMLDALAPCAQRLIVTRARNVRAADLERIAQMATERHAAVEVSGSVAAALDRALGNGDPVVVTGSIFVVAEAREAWFERIGQPITDRDA
jgi:dihydrofolate synthase/folylpolyglutamate synthase